MTGKTVRLFLIALFFGISFSPLWGSQSIDEILNKGSRWTLTVDQETHILELLGGVGSQVPGGGWSMKMEVKWNDIGGILKAQSNADNTEQTVILSLQNEKNEHVLCEGKIDPQNNQFMSGTSRYPKLEKAQIGSWQATKLNADTPVSATPERRHGKDLLIRRDKDTVLKPLSLDKEPPQASIEVEGILVFTIKDTIKLKAQAEDNEKVTKLTVYIDQQPVKTCEAWMCLYSQVLTQAGPHTCWAVAEDAAGNKGQSKTIEFMVHPTAKPGPALTTRIQPYHPTSQDKITFSAQASHTSGVASITIYIAGQAVKTCPGSSCEYVGGPYTGNIVWRVSAKANDGGENYGYDKTLEIKPLTVGTASISGKVYGSGVNAAGVFFIHLYGPNDLHLFREEKKFDTTGHYSFTGLPAGQYQLRVDTKADIAIGPHPNSRIVQCDTNAITDIDFELK